MVGRSMTVYRNPARQAAARTGRQETPSPVQEAPNRNQTPQGLNPRAVSTLPTQAIPNAAEYGFVFQCGPERISVKAPGEMVAVLLSDQGALSTGVTHEAGSSELYIHNAGDYLLDFALYINSDHAKPVTFALQANGDHIPGGIWDVPLRTGYQTLTGFVMAHINENSRIRIVMTASSPAEIILAGCGTTASLSVRKL